MQKQEETRSFEDYSLFDDITDDALRIRNQGVVMRNIAVAGRSKNNTKVSATAASKLMSYFGMIDPKDRGAVMKAFSYHCEQDGFIATPGA